MGVKWLGKRKNWSVLWYYFLMKVWYILKTFLFIIDMFMLNLLYCKFTLIDNWNRFRQNLSAVHITPSLMGW